MAQLNPNEFSIELLKTAKKIIKAELLDDKFPSDEYKKGVNDSINVINLAIKRFKENSDENQSNS